MPKNNRLPSTVTRSISFRFDVLAALDERVDELRSDRSSVINSMLEHAFGIMAHPEIVGNVPFRSASAAARKRWAEVVEATISKEPAEVLARRQRGKTKGVPPHSGEPGQLVKRTGKIIAEPFTY